METNTMTDSELLAYARSITANDYELYQPHHLARFVASMLDDSPVTMKALERVAADSDGLLVMSDGQMWIDGTDIYFECGIDDMCRMICDTNEYAICDVPDMSTLRCLLRGLGVGA